ncbi:unnamed protein product [Notodromas monacha]|uniref:Large ribosomal subunit protein mL44 n=1 Tax=Notodromas monacha TaxID=399045 RepID=A0A7R9GEZ7_9CRUS|nr:unnamed protein product [Notodromas monacha]CAG0920156.1 unnamed protein product [Notodromas monacha]
MANTLRQYLKHLTHRKLLVTYPVVAVAIGLGLYMERVESGRAVSFHNKSHLFYKEPSSSENLNYDAELYAFGKRLGEDFDPQILRLALTHKSHIEAETQRRRSLGVSDADLNTDQHNGLLLKAGRTFVSSYLLRHLQAAFPAFPKEGISSLNGYLMSDDALSVVSFHLGVKDLILCQEYPPSETTLADTFLAIVAALNGDAVRERFIRDFLVTQLCGKNVYEIWNPADPKKLVTEILLATRKSAPESRLLRKTAVNTLEANFNVGIYCDQRLIGYGSGETATIAENSAFVDVLRRMFRLDDSRSPLQFPIEVESPDPIHARLQARE